MFHKRRVYKFESPLRHHVKQGIGGRHASGRKRVMWMIRAENRYQVLRVDRGVVTLSNRYGAEFEVAITDLVVNGYRLECEQGADIPVWWRDAQGDVVPQSKPEPKPEVDTETVEKPEPVLAQSVKQDVFGLFDF